MQVIQENISEISKNASVHGANCFKSDWSSQIIIADKVGLNVRMTQSETCAAIEPFP